MQIFPPKRFFNKTQEARIVETIQMAERNTSGEIKVHVESRAKQEVFQRALAVFEELNMHQTQQRNGVLIYLATKDHQFAIVADEGINEVVPEHFWDQIKDQMHQQFKKKHFTEGLSEGIRMIGEQLQAHFPYQSDDQNEISDDISTGD